MVKLKIKQRDLRAELGWQRAELRQVNPQGIKAATVSRRKLIWALSWETVGHKNSRLFLKIQDGKHLRKEPRRISKR